MFPPDDDLDFEGEDGDFEPVPPQDFFPDDFTQEDYETLEDIRNASGRPFADFVTDYSTLVQSGGAGTVRAVNFASGAEALIWLYRRGIFIYSSIVRFSDGSWGVAIGNSPQPEQTGDVTQSSLPSF